MPATALSRAAARAVESGPDGGNLAPGAWQRLEALPDPRSRQGRIYPLACLIAIACARSPRPGTTGSPPSGSGSEELARPAWPGPVGPDRRPVPGTG